MTLSRPAGLDQFARCPVEGCDTDVYAPLYIRQRCRAHGGDGVLPEIRRSDPFGNPRPASADGPPPPSALPPPR